MTQDSWARTRAPRHGQQSAMTRPARGCNTAGLLVKQAATRARMAWPLGCVAIQILYRGGGAALCRDTVRDTAAIRCRSATTRATRRAERATGIRVVKQILYRDRGATTRPAAQIATQPTTRKVRAATRLEGGHDMAPSARRARGLGAMGPQCAQPGFLGCAHYAPNPILYCLQSLFGALFMNTIHRVFKKINK